MSYMEIRNLKKVYNPYGVHPKVALNGILNYLKLRVSL